MTGFNPSSLYKWRARTQYKMTSFPFQKYGPWRYYNNYVPTPAGGFKPKPNILYLNLSVNIEGFYDAGADSMVGDTLIVYLRNITSPYAIVNSAKGFVNSAGLGHFTFSNAANGVNYYLHLQHRNSIETWSKTTQMFTADMLNYNFKTASSQAFGNNQKLVDSSPVTYGIFSGDVNQDGSADLNDVLSVYNASASFSNGYVVNDVNGDNVADLNDVLIAYNNSVGFVAVVRP
ncbi:MAG: hypothetical protein IPL53_24100 [Ignavibacteria bacterium]|nr:hypothetical protein [Ignavibacteria bacterium]